MSWKKHAYRCVSRSWLNDWLVAEVKKGKDANIETVKDLLYAGADPNVETGNQGRTPLWWALNAPLPNNSVGEPIALLLIESGANVDGAVGKHEITPLHLAIAKGYIKTVEIILEKSTRSLDIEYRQKTPLNWAKWHASGRHPQPESFLEQYKPIFNIVNEAVVRTGYLQQEQGAGLGKGWFENEPSIAIGSATELSQQSPPLPTPRSPAAEAALNAAGVDEGGGQLSPLPTPRSPAAEKMLNAAGVGM